MELRMDTTESSRGFFDINEAEASLLEPLLGRSPFATHGQRVVESQRLMQAASDIFLGWVQSDEELDGGAQDFYLRQLWDWNISVDIASIRPRGLVAYATACRDLIEAVAEGRVNAVEGRLGTGSAPVHLQEG